MLIRLLLLFILVPAAELALLIEIGQLIGTLPTLGLIALTGILGAGLTRLQGLGVVRRMRREVHEGRLPAGSLIDGVIILIAGALLITPGLITDLVGFLCLVPAFRKLVKKQLGRWLERAVRTGRVQVVMSTGRQRPADRESSEVIEPDHRRLDGGEANERP